VDVPLQIYARCIVGQDDLAKPHTAAPDRTKAHSPVHRKGRDRWRHHGDHGTAGQLRP
jgi:hypothetical protein